MNLVRLDLSESSLVRLDLCESSLVRLDFCESSLTRFTGRKFFYKEGFEKIKDFYENEPF